VLMVQGLSIGFKVYELGIRNQELWVRVVGLGLPIRGRGFKGLSDRI